MSKKLFTVAFIAALLALSLSQAFAQGARVVLFLNNQKKIAGRLLSVRDSALVISTKEAQGKKFDARAAGIIVVKNQDLQRVIVKGKSGKGVGVGLGLVIGVGAGLVIGSSAGDDPPCDKGYLNPCLGFTSGAKAMLGGVLGGVAGMVLGGLAEFAASEEDRTIYSRRNHDFSALKPFAQFPEQEPEYLTAVK